MDVTRRISAEEYRRYLQNLDNPTAAVEAEEKVRNRISNDRGLLFEDLIKRGCNYYLNKKIAVIEKVPEPYRCIKNMENGRFIGIHTSRAEPDFKGVIAGGKAVAFEAKSTQKSRIQHSILTDKQMSMLECQAEMGALSFVVINIRDKYFSLPWSLWKNMKVLFGKKFLMPPDIADFEVVFDGAVRFLEYKNGINIFTEGLAEV